MTLEFFTFNYDDYVFNGIWCTLHMGSPKTSGYMVRKLFKSIGID